MGTFVSMWLLYKLLYSNDKTVTNFKVYIIICIKYKETFNLYKCNLLNNMTALFDGECKYLSILIVWKTWKMYILYFLKKIQHPMK